MAASPLGSRSRLSTVPAHRIDADAHRQPRPAQRTLVRSAPSPTTRPPPRRTASRRSPATAAPGLLHRVVDGHLAQRAAQRRQRDGHRPVAHPQDIEQHRHPLEPGAGLVVADPHRVDAEGAPAAQTLVALGHDLRAAGVAQRLGAPLARAGRGGSPQLGVGAAPWLPDRPRAGRAAGSPPDAWRGSWHATARIGPASYPNPTSA